MLNPTDDTSMDVDRAEALAEAIANHHPPKRPNWRVANDDDSVVTIVLHRRKGPDLYRAVRPTDYELIKNFRWYAESQGKSASTGDLLFRVVTTIGKRTVGLGSLLRFLKDGSRELKVAPPASAEEWGGGIGEADGKETVLR